MREKKFRIWCKTVNRFTDSAHVSASGGQLLWLHTSNEVSISNLDEGDYEVQQFTGLKDRNDKEIYEGDLVKWIVIPLGLRYENEFLDWEKQGKPMQEIIKEVKWVYNCYPCFSETAFGPYSPNECEIIGNIFENPELLKLVLS